ncbi:MAG: 1-deoxy-D-xylulose-5-phosphate synthase [Clostridia bacterium]|nr:1-deoxy-D-xylulose-5-phosphate synthase [Clostridia bacterium]
MSTDKKTLLESIGSPRDLKGFSEQQLNTLCAELRDKILTTVSRTGGHLASNLGVVELTVALHATMNCPDDQIVWDVGHQCYAHKLLTGRLECFDTLRQKGGVSGFPNPKESACDAFVAGHSSTAVSAACGMARANTLAGNGRYTVAVIGDGALTGGLAYEGLNNAGHSNDRLIVILNDNRMSISRNVGFVARHLSNLRSRRNYIRFKRGVSKVLTAIPLIGKPIYRLALRIKLNAKYAMYDSSTMFEDMGFYYFGPINGHDIGDLKQALETAKGIDRPVLLHVETQKGRGYTHAEVDPSRFHGLGAFDPETGKGPASSGGSFSSVFGEELTRLAAEDDRVFAITAAMRDGTGLSAFSEKYPDRFADVDIAEEHAVTFASGLACRGVLPVFAVYSTFLQRCYDQLLNDTAIADNHIVLGIDRAGLVPADGTTHQGLFDTAFLQTIPHVTLLAPSSYEDLRLCLNRALYRDRGIAALRYPRGSERPLPASFAAEDTPFTLYADADKPSKRLLVTYGTLLSEALAAREKLAEIGETVDVLKLTQIVPIPKEALLLAKQYDEVYVAEEGVAEGGVGEKFGSRLHQAGYKGTFSLRAITGFMPTCTVQEGLQMAGLDVDSLVAFVRGEQTAVVTENDYE